MISILLVDNHQIVREGLRALFAKQPDVVCVGEAEDGRQAIEMVRDLHPDIAIMAVALPNLNGIDATRRVVEASPETRVVLLSSHASHASATAALTAGASAYLVQDSSFEDLLRALRIVADGGVYLSQPVAKSMVEDYLVRVSGGLRAPARPQGLSPRQREVLQLLAEGKSSREIADVLYLSTKTVDGYRRQIMEKLGVYSIAGLVKYAIREGLTSAET